MMTMLTTNPLAKVLCLASLLAAMACSGEDPNSDKTQNPITNGKCADDEGADDDGPNDKITCSVDTDCDSDEYCSNGLCTGLDGEDEDDDDEEPGDKINCSVDTDCDADEVCTNGLCT